MYPDKIPDIFLKTTMFYLQSSRRPGPVSIFMYSIFIFNYNFKQKELTRELPTMLRVSFFLSFYSYICKNYQQLWKYLIIYNLYTLENIALYICYIK